MSDYQPSGHTDGSSATAQAQEKVQETAQQATRKGTQMLREQTAARSSQISGELGSVADALRRSSDQLREDGKDQTGAAVEAVTHRLDRLSRYLGETDADQMLRDLESFGRRRPWGMIGLGLGVGLVASRFLKASSETRYASSQPATTYPQTSLQPAQIPPPPVVPEPATQVGYSSPRTS